MLGFASYSVLLNYLFSFLSDFAFFHFLFYFEGVKGNEIRQQAERAGASPGTVVEGDDEFEHTEKR